MKQLLFHLILFSLFFLLVLFIVIGTMGTVAQKAFDKNILTKTGEGGYTHTRMKEMKTIGHVDILVIGSSHAYRGFDPRIFASKGIKIFNLGSSAQTPIQTEILVKEHIDRLKPKLVIFEVFPGVFTNDGVESSLDLITNSDINIGTVMMTLRINNLITYNAFYSMFTGNGFLKIILKNRHVEMASVTSWADLLRKRTLYALKGNRRATFSIGC
ncbi:MAG: hypothetical protein NTW16_08910 [Bacteroidetes bacterium]|nr:hypothetical protein [Bacteroidota bacterium]